MQRYGLAITESPGFNPDTIHWHAQGKLKRGCADKVFPLLGEGIRKHLADDSARVEQYRHLMPEPRESILHACPALCRFQTAIAHLSSGPIILFSAAQTTQSFQFLASAVLGI